MGDHGSADRYETLRAAIAASENPVAAAKALARAAACGRPEYDTQAVAFADAGRVALEPFFGDGAKAIAEAVCAGTWSAIGPPSGNGRPSSSPEPPESLPEPLAAIEIEDVEPPGFLVEDLMLEGELGLIYADPGSFKTTLAIALACAVSAAEPILGREARGGPALIVSEEDDAAVLRDRGRAICRGQGFELSRFDTAVYFLAREGFSLDSEEWREALARWCDTYKPALIVFDPYAELTLAAENSNDEAKPNIRYFRRLTETGATVLVLHHAGKAFEGKRKVDRIRGASALYGACRFAFFLSKRQGTRVELECVKMSRAPVPRPLIVDITIESDPEHPTAWETATLEAVEKPVADRADAELAVLESIDEAPGLLSTELRQAVTARGVDPIECSKVLRTFQARGILTFEQGERNAKHWHLGETGRARLVALRLGGDAG